MEKQFNKQFATGGPNAGKIIVFSRGKNKMVDSEDLIALKVKIAIEKKRTTLETEMMAFEEKKFYTSFYFSIRDWTRLEQEAAARKKRQMIEATQRAQIIEIIQSILADVDAGHRRFWDMTGCPSNHQGFEHYDTMPDLFTKRDIIYTPPRPSAVFLLFFLIFPKVKKIISIVFENRIRRRLH